MTTTTRHTDNPAPANLAPIRRTAFRDALVKSMRVESSCVLSVELTSTDGDPLPPWEPGSHLDLMLPGGLLRQYSLCSEPREPTWRFAVLREPQSRGGSEYVHTELRPGDTVQVRGPRNNFTLQPAEKYLFLAGGIGITPILPMVRHMEEMETPWKLAYLGRSRPSMAFLPELTAYGDRVLIHADDEDGLFDLSGYLTEPQDGTLVYACGPGGLLQVLQNAANSWSDPGKFHSERFVTAPATVADGAPSVDPERGHEGDTPFTIELTSGTEVEVGANQTALEALEEAGYSPLNSCREGICGTCETVVVSGDVDHRDSLLSEEERAAGETMMICVSRAKSCRLVLDLD